MMWCTVYNSKCFISVHTSQITLWLIFFCYRHAVCPLMSIFVCICPVSSYYYQPCRFLLLPAVLITSWSCINVNLASYSACNTGSWRLFSCNSSMIRSADGRAQMFLYLRWRFVFGSILSLEYRARSSVEHFFTRYNRDLKVEFQS